MQDRASPWRDRVVVVDPDGPGLLAALAELWAYRELLWVLTARELQVRYAQTWVGVAWVLLKPAATLLVVWLVFGVVAALPVDGMPPPLFFVSGLVLWFFFSGAVTDAKDSLVASAELVRKVHFPRSLLPIATVLARLVDLAIMLVMLGGLLVHYGLGSLAGLVTAALVVALTALLAIALGLVLAGWNVRYRDTTHVVPVALQLLLFASPVVYSARLVPDRMGMLYALNPLVGLIDGFRSALVGGEAPASLTTAAVVTAALLVAAVFSFRRMEASFADHV